MSELLVTRLPYLASWGLLVLGLALMARSRNLVKQLFGLYFVQTSIILFFMAVGFKEGATAPIVEHTLYTVDPNHYANPLPHVLMLTAIVVGVATQGVAFMLLRRMHFTYKTLEAPELRGLN